MKVIEENRPSDILGIAKGLIASLMKIESRHGLAIVGCKLPKIIKTIADAAKKIFIQKML